VFFRGLGGRAVAGWEEGDGDDHDDHPRTMQDLPVPADDIHTYANSKLSSVIPSIDTEYAVWSCLRGH